MILLSYLHMTVCETLSSFLFRFLPQVKHYGDCVVQMHKLEQKMSSEISNSPVCQQQQENNGENEELKRIAEDYQSVAYQVSSNSEFFRVEEPGTLFNESRNIHQCFTEVNLMCKNQMGPMF